MSNSYKPESVVPEDARRALPVLVEHGYKLAVISNRGKPYPEVVEALGLSPVLRLLAGGRRDQGLQAGARDLPARVQAASG